MNIPGVGASPDPPAKGRGSPSLLCSHRAQGRGGLRDPQKHHAELTQKTCCPSVGGGGCSSSLSWREECAPGWVGVAPSCSRLSRLCLLLGEGPGRSRPVLGLPFIPSAKPNKIHVAMESAARCVGVEEQSLQARSSLSSGLV